MFLKGPSSGHSLEGEGETTPTRKPLCPIIELTQKKFHISPNTPTKGANSLDPKPQSQVKDEAPKAL